MIRDIFERYAKYQIKGQFLWKNGHVQIIKQMSKLYTEIVAQLKISKKKKEKKILIKKI